LLRLEAVLRKEEGLQPTHPLSRLAVQMVRIRVKGDPLLISCTKMVSLFLGITETLRLEGTAWDHLVQSLCFKQRRLQHIAQDHIQAAFKHLQRKRLRHLSRHTVPVLGQHHREAIFSHVQMELPLFQFEPVASRSVARHHQKQPSPILLIPSPGVFVHTNRIPSWSSPG